MATKAEPYKVTYVTLGTEQRATVVREHLRAREDEHFRLFTAFSDSPQNNPRLEAVTKEVGRLQEELKALEAEA